jgi:type IV pilus assembly protein PilA
LAVRKKAVRQRRLLHYLREQAPGAAADEPGSRSESPSPAERGFTFIELLVVILTIAILAAIAYPVFISERDKSYRARVQSALKNGELAMESYAAGHDGDYSGASVPGLRAEEGLRYPARVDLSLAELSANSYCLEATDEGLPGETWSLDQAGGAPRPGVC